MAHLEIEVPSYYAANDPLLTYATPLHPQEEHTTSRQELIGKLQVETTAPTSTENSNSSEDTVVKSWSLDHAYLQTPISEIKKPQQKSSGRLVKSKKIDYKNIMW